MLDLEPCTRCRRHVARGAECPFCARRGVVVSTGILGAALTAATLSLAACGDEATKPADSAAPTNKPSSSAAGSAKPSASATQSAAPSASASAAPSASASAAPSASSAPTVTPPSTVKPPEPDNRMRPKYGISPPPS